MKIIKNNSNWIEIRSDLDILESFFQPIGLFISDHPRATTQILISKTPTSQDEQESIVVDASLVTNVGGVAFSGDRQALKNALVLLFSVGGSAGSNRSTKIVDSGVDVICDNIKIRLSPTSMRSLEIATVAGTLSMTGSAICCYNSAAMVSSTFQNKTINTNYQLIIGGWSLGNAGNTQEVLMYDAAAKKAYRISLIIGASYLQNQIVVERIN
ncbi:hypothetical protein B0A58_07475 [Flavobacterium branchiophilum NBRC 15030 = ATCC 35035]|uniref:Uncharacterized protein n=1 Tax=Flavobacterium branchiophilum TaxID=55197 RepID=A0A543G128_9FLAO|nr:hypothetical protein [Flavobacterium branchiophilum]OXA76404.1 hypothetical protein B0A58_07475 [Flavobacterium branchiophilum NBRC 15030 = ATCC 35035]TQM39771.1 hypothetical protein BC670_0602 [Flavobacterium branchiophilum]GEM55232.1 hypothetical protein FB1_14530 [Flavobacterium branchiophilum NBRC 15030 = ATCC 35035]